MSKGSSASRDSHPEENFPGQAIPEGPADDVHAWYLRGLDLLDRGSPAAAAQILQRASAAEPQSRSVREALARAQFDAGRYADAAGNFRMIVEASPSDDYANFGLGLALSRMGDHAAAAEYLALAAAMRPDAAHYTEALRSVRATLRARQAPRETQAPKETPAPRETKETPAPRETKETPAPRDTPEGDAE
jgi:tetratricopeptide (TPR) repeat protein